MFADSSAYKIGYTEICPRYPIPKSLSSGKRLAIASLQEFLSFVFCFTYAFFQRVKRNPIWALNPISGPQMQLASNVGRLGFSAPMIGFF